MRSRLTQSSDPPLGAREGRRVDLELLRFQNKRSSGLQRRYIATVSEFGLQIATYDTVVLDKRPVFLEKAVGTLALEHGLKSFTIFSISYPFGLLVFHYLSCEGSSALHRPGH